MMMLLSPDGLIPLLSPYYSLLGHMDLDTREWFDGVLVAAARSAVSEELTTSTWIICDGDIDPEWIEALNSVLDDNRLLTLPSGERIQFGPNVNFIFETHDLKYASPATVSRMGMIYFSECVNNQSYISGWLQQQPADRRESLDSWIKAFLMPVFDAYSDRDRLCVPVNKLALLKNVLSRLDGVTSKVEFALEMFKGLYANLLELHRQPLATDIALRIGELQASSTFLHNCYWNCESGNIETFSGKSNDVSNLTISHTADDDHPPIVETSRLQRDTESVSMWIRHGHPLLLLGPDGAGKQLTLRNALADMTSCALVTVHCSALTSTVDIQRVLAQYCLAVTTAHGKVYRPKDSEKLVVYLRDVHLPVRDKFGTVQVLELMQQIVRYNGFHDMDLNWLRLENVQLVFSTTQPHAKSLPSRFLGSVRHFYVTSPTAEDLKVVYSSMMKSMLAGVISPNEGERLGAMAVQVFDEVRRRFPVAERAHYQFTPRDLTKLVFSLRKYDICGGENPIQAVLDAVVHEVLRLVGDRLVLHDNRTTLREDILIPAVNSAFGIKPSFEGHLFFLNAAGSKPDPLFSQVAADDFRATVIKALTAYERDHRDLAMILHDENLDGMASIYHGLIDVKAPLVLIGRPGCNLRGGVEVIANMLSLDLVSPAITRGYAMKSFVNDLKSTVQTSVMAERRQLLLLETFHFIEPEFLQLINGILSSGDISRIYSKEEYELVLANMKSSASYADAASRGTSIHDYVAQRARRYLKIVIVFDSSMADLPSMLEANPALLTSCRLRWIDDYAKESYVRQAQVMLGDTIAKESNGDKLASALVQLHGITSVYTKLSPMDFANVVALYRRLCESKREKLVSESTRYESGLSKLESAARHVDELKAEAAKQTAELNEKQREADVALRSISDSMVNASEQKKQMEELTRELRVEEEAIQKRKAAVELELSAVEPLIKGMRRWINSSTRISSLNLLHSSCA